MHLSDDERRRFQQLVHDLRAPDDRSAPLVGDFGRCTESALQRLVLASVAFAGALFLLAVGGLPWVTAALALAPPTLGVVLVVDRCRRRRR